MEKRVCKAPETPTQLRHECQHQLVRGELRSWGQELELTVAPPRQFKKHKAALLPLTYTFHVAHKLSKMSLPPVQHQHDGEGMFSGSTVQTSSSESCFLCPAPHLPFSLPSFLCFFTLLPSFTGSPRASVATQPELGQLSWLTATAEPSPLPVPQAGLSPSHRLCSQTPFGSQGLTPSWPGEEALL